jgi:hypothetical protein
MEEQEEFDFVDSLPELTEKLRQLNAMQTGHDTEEPINLNPYLEGMDELFEL